MTLEAALVGTAWLVRRDGMSKRIRLEPIEVWAHNNSWRIHEWRLFEMEKDRQSWCATGTTPNREWWKGFWFAFASMLFVMFVTYLLVS